MEQTNTKQVERYVRVLRERFRCVKSSLWYKLPQCLYPHLMEDIAMFLNTVPNARLNNQHSPREIVEGLKVEYKPHLRVPFGAFGEFRVPNLSKSHPNDKNPSTGIVIGRNLDQTGSLKVWLLESEVIVNRAKIIRILNATAEARLRIASKSAQAVIADSELIQPYNKQLDHARKGVVNNPSEAIQSVSAKRGRELITRKK